MAGNGQRLDIRQGQSLTMTPQLQQSLAILQYSNQELVDFVDAEVEGNPLLEKAESVDSPSSDDVEGNSDSNIDVDDGLPSGENQVDILDVDYGDSWDSNGDKHDETSRRSPVEEVVGLQINTSVSDSYKYSSGGDGNSFVDQIIADSPSLREHLEGQVLIDFPTDASKIIASYMIDMLDVSGYFIAKLSVVTKAFGCKIGDVKIILARLQQCDPVGIFAQDLKQCLALQLKSLNRFDPAMEKLVNNIDLLAKGEVKKLRKLCKVDAEDFEEMVAEVRKLNPRPSSGFSTEITQTFQIDVYTKKNPDKTWSVELNNEALPRVLVNNTYYSEVKKYAKSKVEKEFVVEKYQSANWLIKALNQRAESILKISTELVIQQQDFFEKGIYFFKPLKLADIASVVGVHESTVGRIVNNKYISTPNGVFELKYFFSSSVGTSIGEGDVSSKAVKYMIKEMVVAESDFKSVLSDDKISDNLQKKNVDCARRTVAKYRESMQIPSSAVRKRQKKLQAGL